MNINLTATITATETAMTDFNETMQAYARSFEYKTRDNGDGYYCHTLDAPEWCQELTQDVHSALWGKLPDDWTYDQCHTIALELSDYEDAEDASDNYVPSVDIYPHSLLEWLADGNVDIVDEACEEYGVEGGIVQRVMVGQQYALDIIKRSIIDGVLLEMGE